MIVLHIAKQEQINPLISLMTDLPQEILGINVSSSQYQPFQNTGMAFLNQF